MRLLRNRGSRTKYHHEEHGLNSPLDPIPAAILSVKSQHLPKWNASRRRHAQLYDRLLAERADLARPVDRAEDSPSYHIYAIRARKRDRILQRLLDHGIGAAIHYPFAIYQLSAYRSLASSHISLSASERWAAETLSLPMYAEVADAETYRVVQGL